MLAALLGIALGQQLVDLRGMGRQLQRQRMSGQALELVDTESALIERKQALAGGLQQLRVGLLQGLEDLDLELVIGHLGGIRVLPVAQVTRRALVLAQVDQQLDQLQTQLGVFRVGRQQQLGIVGRDRIGLLAIGQEHFLAVIGQQQQATHGPGRQQQRPGLEQADRLSCR